jgi:hypothetical protein
LRFEAAKSPGSPIQPIAGEWHFCKGDRDVFTISVPSMVDELARLEPLVGLFLLAVGLLFMLMGLRLSRMVIGMSFGVVGFVVGASLPGTGETRVVLGMLLALVLGGASLWARRVATSVLTGLWFALVGALVVGDMGLDTQITLVAVAILFACGASLAIVLSSEMTAMVTSLEGTLLFICGMIVIANQAPTFWGHLRSMLVSTPILGLFAVFSGTVIGSYMQIAELQKKKTGRSA